MFSILIPTYNYNVQPLVVALYQQCCKSKIDFEILVYDDGSKSPENIFNEDINLLKNCSFKELPNNIGRSAIRNLLARDSKFNWLLFLDADVIPKNNDFINNYQAFISKEPQVIYGGIRYSDIKPEQSELLRWVYGRKREALKVKVRNENKYLRFLTLNFMTHKTLFDIVSFNEDIPNLRHEDTLFAIDLEKNQVKLIHIDNPVIHLGLESSQIFLRKSLESVKSLSSFIDRGLIDPDKVLLSKTYLLASRFGLNRIIAWIYKKFKTNFEKHLLSKSPNLFIFDLYRLGFFCSLKTKY